MYPNLWKAYKEACKTPEGEHAWKEARSLSNLIHRCQDHINVKDGLASVNYKDMHYEHSNVFRAFEWILDVRYNIKVELTSIKPLRFKKLLDSGPILAAERNTSKLQYHKLTVNPEEYQLLITELERAAQYAEPKEQGMLIEMVTRLKTFVT